MEEGDKFPWFNDGDVLIVLTAARQFKLHRNVLRNASPTLNRLLHDTFVTKTGKTLPKRLRQPGKIIRHRLSGEANDGDDLLPNVTLQPVHLDEYGQPLVPDILPPLPLTFENGRAVNPVYPAYEMVLGAMYNCDLDFGDFDVTSLDDILEKAQHVLLVAEYLQVVHLVTKSIEASLLATGQAVYRAIADMPAAWLLLAYRMQCKSIFKEAVIHVTGQYNTLEVRATINNFPSSIRKIVEDKVNTLKGGLEVAQQSIMAHYPSNITRDAFGDKAKLTKDSYASDVVTWMAVAAYRQWMGMNLVRDKTHQANDMGFAFFTQLHKGGEAYLGREALEQFTKLFPMSPKLTSVLRERLLGIKDTVKESFAAPFMENKSQLDTSTHSHGFFTCTYVDSADFPWLMEEQEEDESSEDEH